MSRAPRITWSAQLGRTGSRTASLLVLIGLLSACGGDIETTSVCVPGEPGVCVCGSLGGTHVCLPDRTWGPCSCEDFDAAADTEEDLAEDTAADTEEDLAEDSPDDPSNDGRDDLVEEVDISSDSGADLSDAQISGACESGEARCSDGRLQLCSGDGAWVDLAEECDADEVCRRGACEPVPGGYGDDCSSDDCQGELVCDDDVCLTREPGTRGESCVDDLECVDPFWCNGVGVCTVGEEGADCMAHSDCGASAPICSSDRACAENAAPVLDPSAVLSLDPVAEDTVGSGTLVSALLATGGADPITDEDPEAVDGIAVTAVDGTHGAWAYSLDGGDEWTSFGAVADDGAVLLAASDETRVRFVPDADWNGLVEEGLGFRAWDATDGGSEGDRADTTDNGGRSAFSAASETASITVTPVNDAPVLEQTALTLDPIDEDETEGSTLVSDLVGSAITDVDDGALEGVAITAADTTNGSWSYQLEDGGSWAGFDTFTEDAALLLPSDGEARVRFAPNLHWNGTIESALSLRAWDQSAGSAGTLADTTANGGETAISVVAGSASITVAALNDAPVAINDSAVVDEGGTVTLVDSDKTTVLHNDSDAEDANASLTVTVETGPANASAFTLNDDGTFSYTHDGGEDLSDSFVYRVCDADGEPACSTARATITINPVNDPPVISGSAGTAATEDIEYEFEPDAVDPDGPSEVWSRLGDDTCGGSVNESTGKYTFTPAGPVPIASCVVSIELCDGGSPDECDTETATVNVAAVNDPPVRVSDRLVLDEGETAAIGTAALQYTDPEASALTYTVSGLPSSGTLFFDDDPGEGALPLPLGRGDTFTPADLASGRLTYVHLGAEPDGTEAADDSLGFTVTDDTDPVSGTLGIQVLPINDLPTITAIADQFILAGETTGLIAVTIDDEETPADDLALTAVSDDQTLVPDGNIQRGGSGADRTVLVTPAVGETGSATLTVTVTDGGGESAESLFVLTVVPSCGLNDHFAASRPLELHEPCAEMSPAWPDGCEPETWANPGGASSWHRTDEPVEIPLVNGYLDSSVVGYWPLDGDGSDRSLDAHQLNPHDATYSGGFDGQDNGSVALNGSSDYVSVETTLLDNTPEWTVAFYFRPNAVVQAGGARQDLVYRTLGGDLDYGTIHMSLNDTDGELTFTWASSFRNSVSDSIPFGRLEADEWHHIAMVKGSGLVTQAWLDGELLNMDWQSEGTPVEQIGSAGAWDIGRRPDGTNYFDGAIDEVIILNRALTPTELAAYYNSGQPFGSSLVPGSQPDFDDTRVTEDGERVPHEVIGVRPHSDQDLDNIVAYWPMDGDAADISANRHNGVAESYVPAVGRFGDAGGALDLTDGSTAIDVRGDEAFTPNQLTIEAWVWPRGNGKIISLQDGTASSDGSDGWFLFVQSDRVQFWMSSDVEVWLEAPIELERWNHVAGTWDGRTAQLFVDGVRIDGPTDYSAGLPAGANRLLIGCKGSSEGCHDDEQYFRGLIDEVIIHDVARSPDYIYNRANPGVPVVRFLASTDESTNDDGNYDYRDYTLHWDNPDAEYIPPLVTDPDGLAPCEGLLSPCNGYAGWWRFDEGAGTAAVDMSTFRNHAALENGAAWGAQPGARDMALNLTGDGSDGARVPSASHYDPGVAFTVSARITARARVPGIYQAYLVRRWGTTHGTRQFMLGLTSSTPSYPEVPRDSLVFWVWPRDGDESDHVHSDQEISLNIPHHAAASWDGETLSLLVDYHTQTDSHPYTEPFAAVSADLTVGLDPGPVSSVPFDGLLDDVRIMNRALPAEELLHYPLTAWRTDSKETESDLCVHTPLREGSICTADTACLSANCSQDRCAPGGWAYIPPGTFCMGSPDGETECMGETPEAELGRGDDETLHQVTLTRGLLMQRTEVTQREWRALMGNNPSHYSACGDDCPVENVNWWDTAAYLNAMSRSDDLAECYTLTGCTGTAGVDLSCTDVTVTAPDENPYLCAGYRFPMEAEWEYAYRGGTTTAFHGGNITTTGRTPLEPSLGEVGWYGGNSGVSYSEAFDCSGWYEEAAACGTHPVGAKTPNPSGLYDVSGNVYEWVWDWSGDYGTSPVVDPTGGPDGTTRVHRGGAWYDPAEYCRAAWRTSATLAYSSHIVGIRPVRTVFFACDDSADCGGLTPICGPRATCQVGGIGESCVGDAHCGASAPYCSPEGACQVGVEGDTCADADDCGESAPICSPNGSCQDGSPGDVCDTEADCTDTDCLSGVCCASEAETFPSSRVISLSEPCAEMSPAWPGDCYSADLANPGGASTWQRTNEPVEIPLVNGYLDSSVVGYWPFDEGTGAVAADASSNDFEAQLSEGGAWGASAVGASGLNCSGASECGHVSFGDLLPGGELTVSLWVRPADGAPEPGTFWTAISLYPTFDLSVSSSGLLNYTFSVEAADWNRTETDIELVAGEWALVTLTYDGAHLRLWKNAVLALSVPATGGVYGESYDILIGAHNLGASGSDWWSGDLDDILIVGRAFTPAEIAALYDSRQPYGTPLVPDAQPDFDDIRVTENGERVTHEVVGVRPHSDTDLDGVVAYWPFDGDATDVVDGHDGTRVGDPEAAAGRFGDSAGALEFNGTTSRVETPFVMHWLPGESFTAELWARIDGGTAAVLMGYSEYPGSGGEMWLYVDNESDYASFEIRDNEGTFSTARYDVSLDDGVWHHFAGVRDAEKDWIVLYVDGVEQARSGGNSQTTMNTPGGRPLFIGAHNNNVGLSGVLTGAIDEVIIHDVARSADYIYNRANPGVPMVRFLASTEASANDDGRYDYNDYALHWGNADAEYLAPRVPDPEDIEPCEGLLSPCHGYAGWWRFGMGPSGRPVDASTNRLPIVTNNLAAAPSPAGVAGVFDGTSSWARVDIAPPLLFGSGPFTVEHIMRASVVPAGSQGQTVGRSQHNVIPRWAVGVSSVGGGHLYMNDLSDEANASSGPNLLLDAQWHHLAGRRTATDLRVYVDYRAEGTSDASLIDSVDGASPLHIGWYGDLAQPRYFQGDLASIRIMNRALPADELLHYPLSAWELGGVDDARSACFPAPAALSASCGSDIDCVSLNCHLDVCMPSGRIVFVGQTPDQSRREVYVVGLNGEAPVAVTSDDSNQDWAAWDPSGESIVFVDGDGSWLYRLTLDPPDIETINSDQAWRYSHVARDGRITVGVNGREIWTMAADGTGATRVFSGGDDQTSPAWSADGTQLAWASDKYTCSRGIRVSDDTGDNVRKLGSVYLWDWGQVSWSPDGTRIAYATRGSETCWPEGPDEWRIFTVDVSTEEVVQITSHAGDHRYPEWIDDDHIVFGATEAGGDDWNLYMVDLRTSQVWPITTGMTEVRRPRYLE